MAVAREALDSRAASGTRSDREGLELSYRRHARAVYASALRILGDPAGAEDAAQDVFLKLCRDPSGFDPARGELGPYLQMMGRSRALDLWRSQEARTRSLERLSLREPAGPAEAAPEPTEAAERRAERARALAALRCLPAPQREAVFLSFWGGMSNAEIASRAGVPAGTIKSRVRLGLEKLAAGWPVVAEMR